MELKAFVKHVFHKSFLELSTSRIEPFVLKADDLLVFFGCPRSRLGIDAAEQRTKSPLIRSTCRTVGPKDPFNPMPIAPKEALLIGVEELRPLWPSKVAALVVSSTTARLMSLIRSEEKSREGREDLRTT